MDIHFKQALATDPEGLTEVIDLARQIWKGEELAAWMTTPNPRFADTSPIERCGIEDGADDVLDFLALIELLGND